MVDRIEFAAPFGPIGHLVGRLVLAKGLSSCRSRSLLDHWSGGLLFCWRQARVAGASPLFGFSKALSLPEGFN
jgi:hypothetical protein